MFHKLNLSNQVIRLIILALTLFGLASSIILPFNTSAASSRLVGGASSARSVALSDSRIASPIGAERLQSLGQLPLRFETNLGQANSRVKFIGRGRGYTVFLTSTEAVLSLRKAAGSNISRNADEDLAFATERNKQTSETTSLRIKLVGARANSSATGLNELGDKSNYFIGKDPTKWRSGIQNYAKVKYSNVYPGVDLIYYGNQGQLEYDFVVAPGANPKRIRLEFNGADKVYLDSSGDLVLNTKAGEIRQSKPMVYQEAAGVRREISGEYVLKGKHRVGFQLGDYDATKPLVIDPVIAYSSLLGGSGGSELASWANGIATHTAADGNVYVYVVGITTQTDFPVSNAYQPAFGGNGPAAWAGDVFVAKFNMAASGDASLIYSTYLGGSNNEFGAGIAVDSAGNAYVTGFTGSTDFPILKAAQSSLGGGSSDAFVTGVNPDGTSLIYSTYLGGSLADAAASIAVDSTGHAYVTGKTNSANFPVVNAYQPTPQGSNAAFVAKLASPVGFDPASLVYSTYLGGSSVPITGGGFFHESSERANGIAVDSAGNAYVTGVTGSSNFPVLNGFQTELRCAQGNVFVTKLNPSASGPASLLYSTYLGGSCDPGGGDTGYGIAVDSAGNTYITGVTKSQDFPTTAGAFMRNRRTSDTGFIAKIDPAQSGASSLIYSTLVGGFSMNAPEGARSIAVDAQGNAYVTGDTYSYDFPLVNATQSFNSGVFQTIDSGTSWVGLNSGLASPSLIALAIDTSTSPRTLYAAAREHHHADLGLVVMGGVFKSTDGGLSWSATNEGLTNTDVRVLVISPINPSMLYTATAGGIFKSTNGGASWNSLNAGLSETAITSITALAFDTRTSPATVYAGALDGLYKISDGGSVWSFAGLTNSVQSLTIDPSTSPSTLYVAGSDSSAHRSADGGVTWANLQPPDGSTFTSFAVDPRTTPATVYAINVGDEGFNVWNSMDTGDSWQILTASGAINGGTLAVDATKTPITLFVGHPGNVLAQSTDGGNTWSHIYRSGIVAFAVDTTAATAITPSVLYIINQIEADAFVAKLNSTGSALLFSTFLGGHGLDYGHGIALDSSGNIYVAGKTQQGPFPTVNAYQAVSRGGSVDAFVTKLGSAALPSSSAGNVTTEMAVQTGTLELSFPNITGSTSGTAPTATVNALDSTTTANLTLSNNLGAYEIKTTATYDTSGYASDPTNGIKIAFSVPTVNDLAVFNNLVISHGEDSNADGIIQLSEMIPYNGTVDSNKVTYHDFATRTVWVYVPSLSPFVIVKGAGDQFSDLVRLVKSFNLKAGIENSLDVKLQNALKAYQAALAKDRATACNHMGAFASQVQAQTGKALTQARANQLITAANQIKGVLGCR